MKTYRLTSWARTWHYLPYQTAQYTCKWTSRYLWSVWRTSAPFLTIIDIIQCQICQFSLSLYFSKRLLVFSVLENTRKFKKEKKTKKHWLFHQLEMTKVNILVYFLSVMFIGNLFPLSPHCIWIIYCFDPSVLVYHSFIFINILRVTTYYYTCSIILLTTALLFIFILLAVVLIYINKWYFRKIPINIPSGSCMCSSEKPHHKCWVLITNFIVKMLSPYFNLQFFKYYTSFLLAILLLLISIISIYL